MRLMSRCTLSLVFLLCLPAPLLAQELAATSGAHAMTFVAIDRLQWSPIDVPGFEPGMRIAVLSGDPASDGSYTIRLAFPDGYRFPSHWHPQAENLTVLMGTFLLGEGTEEDPDKWYWFEGNFEAYEANKIERLGPDAARPHRTAYRKLTRD